MAYTCNPTIVPNGGISTATTSTVTLSGGAGAGYVLNTGAGGNGTWVASATSSYTMPNPNFNDGTDSLLTIPHGKKTVILEEKATLEVKGTVVINGVNLEDRLERIETLLQIPIRDVTMEAKYPKLKKIWEEYNRELAKLKTWDALKGEE